MSRRVPIRWQVFLPLAGLLLAAVLSVSSLGAWQASRRTEAELQDRVAGVVRTLGTSSFPLTDAVLAQMSGLSGAEFVVRDRAGNVLASSRDFGPLNYPTPPEGLVRMTQAPRVELQGTAYFVSRAPVERPGAETRLLDVFVPVQAWQAARSDATWPSLLVGGSTLLACGALATLLTGRVTQPIVRLQRQIGRLAAGDFATLPLPPRNDELLDLARSVNRLAEELQTLRQAVQRSERLALLGQLSGGLAHHLRNDVTGARLAIELHAQDRCTGDAESLQVALRQLALTEEHLRGFLTAGQPQPPARALHDPAALVRQTVELLAPMARHRRIELQFQHDDQAAATVEVDADQVRQALVNVLVNAIEAAPAGGYVHVRLQTTDVAVVCAVCDNGPGVPAELAGKLFEHFVSGKPEGIGLGLAVARQICEAHGGGLRYERIAGETLFTLELPALEPVVVELPRA